jgi:threonine aldolase
MIDLRSDTVTRPTPEMYAAMAAAPLGDDGWRDDPTVLELEDFCAELLGKKRALFLPSSTMANLVAMLAHANRSGELIAEANSFILAGTGNGSYSSVAGLTARPIPGRRGVMDLEMLEAAIRPEGDRIALPTALISIENTHTVENGAVLPIDHMATVSGLARRSGIPVFLDGARLFNAAAALNVSLRSLAEHADSVAISLCKGLGAPAGAILAGDAATINRALAFRKTLGGAMRQSGLLAACALVALRAPLDYFRDDHIHARELAEGIHQLDQGMVERDTVATNLLTFYVRRTGRDARAWAAALAQRGVLVAALPPWGLRLVTHRGIGATDVTAALRAFASVRAECPQ